jgi:hypothetical protein
VTFWSPEGQAIMDASTAEIAQAMADPTVVHSPVQVDWLPGPDGGLEPHFHGPVSYEVVPDE